MDPFEEMHELVVIRSNIPCCLRVSILDKCATRDLG
jgi:hypothetical protein